MTYRVIETELGVQPIADTETTAQHELGKEVRAIDSISGHGLFKYLLGVASTEVGSVVRWNATTYQTTLLANTAGQACPVAVAMSANVASQYGWYQVEGMAVVKKTAVAVAPNIAMYISATAGRVKVVASNGVQIIGARTANLATVTSTTSTIVMQVSRPSAQGQAT